MLTSASSAASGVLAGAWRIGLTGGIGSGKSTVAAMLVRLGAGLIDTDAISRRLTAAGGAGIEPLRTSFGSAAIDAEGALDRAWMRERAFSDATVKQRLEAILHPLIGAETRRQAEASPQPVHVYDVPLLVESVQWRGRVDRVWVVDCSEDTQVRRVMQRSGWTDTTVQAVIERQASRARRRAAADAVLHNDGLTLAELEIEVRDLWRSLVG